VLGALNFVVYGRIFLNQSNRRSTIQDLFTYEISW